MTPDKHGYVRCERCGTLRPAVELVTMRWHVQGAEHVTVVCADVSFCTKAIMQPFAEVKP